MNKVKIDDLLVVEGITDKAFLLEFVEAKIMVTNGSAISRETIKTIENFSKQYPIIVMTDPDYPGDQIRNKIAEAVPSAKHVFLQKERCIKSGKVGLAQSNAQYILEQLKRVVTPIDSPIESISIADLQEFGLIGGNQSNHLRENLGQILGIGKTNGKTLLQRLNWLKITREKLINLLKGNGYAK